MITIFSDLFSCGIHFECQLFGLDFSYILCFYIIFILYYVFAFFSLILWVSWLVAVGYNSLLEFVLKKVGRFNLVLLILFFD